MKQNILCPVCGSWCGTTYPATHTDPDYSEGPGEDYVSRDGFWCCSNDCVDEMDRNLTEQ